MRRYLSAEMSTTGTFSTCTLMQMWGHSLATQLKSLDMLTGHRKRKCNGAKMRSSGSLCEWQCKLRFSSHHAAVRSLQVAALPRGSWQWLFLFRIACGTCTYTNTNKHETQTRSLLSTTMQAHREHRWWQIFHLCYWQSYKPCNVQHVTGIYGRVHHCAVFVLRFVFSSCILYYIFSWKQLTNAQINGRIT